MQSIPLPWCVVCNAPVERLSSDKDILRDETIFVAHCHGKSERVTLSATELAQARGQVWSGQAFEIKAFAGEAKPLLAAGESDDLVCEVCGLAAASFFWVEGDDCPRNGVYIPPRDLCTGKLRQNRRDVPREPPTE